MSSPLGRIHQIAIRSSDLDRSIAFYRDVLGVELIARFDPPGMAFLRFGETRLLLEKAANPGTLYFWVDDLEEAVRTLRGKGVQFDDEPLVIHRDDARQFGPAGAEEWMAFFRDPDDNVLALASQVLPEGARGGAVPVHEVSTPGPDHSVTVNGRELTTTELDQLEAICRVRPAPGYYWYDSVSGMYENLGQPAAGSCFRATSSVRSTQIPPAVPRVS